jgi:hypothetical protein
LAGKAGLANHTVARYVSEGDHDVGGCEQEGRGKADGRGEDGDDCQLVR